MYQYLYPHHRVRPCCGPALQPSSTSCHRQSRSTKQVILCMAEASASTMYVYKYVCHCSIHTSTCDHLVGNLHASLQPLIFRCRTNQ